MPNRNTLGFGIEVVVLTLVMLAGRFFLGSLIAPEDSTPQSNTDDHTHTQEYDDTGFESTHYTLQVTQDQEDELQHLEAMVDDLLHMPHQDSLHQAANKVTLDSLCTRFQLICDKTTWQGSYSSQERLYYQGLLIFLINHLDSAVDQGSPLSTVFSDIGLSPSRPDRRGSAGHTHASFNTSKIDSRDEFFQVATHEIGHLVDLGVITGRSVFKDTTFTEFGKAQRATNDPSLDYYKISWIDETTRKADQGTEAFVSGYSMKNVYEDFAEHLNFYINYHDLFTTAARKNSTLKKKYEYIDQLMDGKYIQSGKQYLDRYTVEKTYRDTTRLGEELR